MRLTLLPLPSDWREATFPEVASLTKGVSHQGRFLNLANSPSATATGVASGFETSEAGEGDTRELRGSNT